jgi:hypothetical protein
MHSGCTIKVNEDGIMSFALDSTHESPNIEVKMLARADPELLNMWSLVQRLGTVHVDNCSSDGCRKNPPARYFAR